jgi:hypothetical protein
MELPTRSQHDEDAAGALAALSARQRHELEQLLGNPPSIANVPQEFWDKVQQETEDELAAILLLIFMRSAEFHGSASAAAGTAAILWARPTAAPFAASFTQTSRDMLAGYGARWEAVIATGQRLTEDVIFEDTNRIFGPGRAARMAVDAVTTGQTAGGEWAVGMFVGTSPNDRWKCNPHLSKSGPCEICSPLDGQPREVWEAEFPMGPPGPHSSCCCEIIYEALDNAENN